MITPTDFSIRRIGKNGVSFFQTDWFFLHPSMASHKGREVRVYYVLADYSRVWVELPDGKTVEATRHPATGAKPQEVTK